MGNFCKLHLINPPDGYPVKRNIKRSLKKLLSTARCYAELVSASNGISSETLKQVQRDRNRVFQKSNKGTIFATFSALRLKLVISLLNLYSHLI